MDQQTTTHSHDIALKLAPLPEAPADVDQKVRRTLWISTLEGCITQNFLTWTTGSVLTGYMLYLGAGPKALAAAASIPLLAQLLNPLTAWLTTRMGSRRQFLITTNIFGRGIWILVAILPILPLSMADKLAAMMAIITISHVLQSGSGPAWTSLMADVVPAETRGRYFGMRTSIVGVMGMLAALGAGWFLDRAPAPVGFQMVYVVAVFLAMVGVYTYGMYYDPGTPRMQISLRESIMVPLRDRNFRKFLVFSSYWNASVMIAAPFVIPYFFTHLKMSYTEIAIWSAIASIFSLFTGPMWGRVADMAGHKTVLSITTVLAGTAHPLCWLLARPGHLMFIWISGVMDALSWGGIHSAIFNLSVSTAPQRMRMTYMAVLGAVNGISGFTAGLLSGPLMNFLLEHEAIVFGYHWTGYHSLFLISGFFRSQAWRFLVAVHEPHAWSARELLRRMRMWPEFGRSN